MTDEEMAEEYKETVHRWRDSKGELVQEEDVKQAFLDGLKAGRPKWHNLRKNPDDLPKRLNFMSETVVNQIGTPCHYNYEQECWQNWSFIEIETPVAWCEIPTFTDKE